MFYTVKKKVNPGLQLDAFYDGKVGDHSLCILTRKPVGPSNCSFSLALIKQQGIAEQCKCIFGA